MLTPDPMAPVGLFVGAATSLAGALDPIHEQHAVVSPLVAGGAVAVAVCLVAIAWPGPGPSRPEDGPFESWDGRLTRPQIAARVLSVVLLAVAVAAGRMGSDDELSNIAPSLVVGLGWPGLLFVSAAAGPIWRWLDPWDAVARGLGADAEDGDDADVRPALVAALALAWYLAVYTESLSPRSVGIALGVYAVVMVAGSLVVGRERWLGRVDVFGLLFGWLSRLPRGLLRAWAPPRGAELVVGALTGGLAFGAVRMSEVWGELNVVEGARLYATLGMLASAVAVAGVLWLLERWAGVAGAPGSVVAAALPGAASIMLVLALARSRLFTSLQLVPALLSDPFGFGWDVFGTRGLPILAPLSPLRLAAVQLGVLLVGGVAGALVLARRTPRQRRGPGIVALAALMALGAWAVTLPPGL